MRSVMVNGMRSIAAAMVALLPMVCLASAILLDEKAGGGVPGDNAPSRAAWALLMTAPLFLMAYTGYFYAVGVLLGRTGRPSLATALYVACAVSVAAGALFGVQGMRVGGPLDASSSFLIVGSGAFLSLASGSWVLWRLYGWRAA